MKHHHIVVIGKRRLSQSLNADRRRMSCLDSGAVVDSRGAGLESSLLRGGLRDEAPSRRILCCGTALASQIQPYSAHPTVAYKEPLAVASS